MSRRKRNNKKRLAQKRMLNDMKKEIEKLEYDIKHSKVTNLKIMALRKMKQSLLVCRLVAPYFLTAGITCGAFSAMGATPFVRDYYKQYLETKKTIDNHNNIKYECQYDEYNDANAKISYVGKWKADTDGFYTREIKIYSLKHIKDIDEEFFINHLTNNSANSLDEILGKPISSKSETRNNLTEAEITEDALIEATLYSKDTNDYIAVKEKLGDNIGTTFLWLIATMFVEIIPKRIRGKYSSFDYDTSKAKIEKNYRPVDINELTKKLEIKSNNYNRLKR